ncbi:MAG: cyclic nucleotide-binding domain-containing protein [Candidatus Cloacimonetes bacterium]|nr:cyclic nucleotide-binding domain-containing protein [Candidatus Cloacimonadota bacterium]
MRTYMIIPTYWCGPEGNWEEGDAVFDHPTPLNEDGTLKRALDSLQILNNNKYTLIILAAATNTKHETQMKKKVKSIIREAQIPVDTILFTNSDLSRLTKKLLNEKHIPDILRMKDYTSIRNMCLFLPYILDADIAILIDDDEIFEDPEFIDKAREFIGKKFYGNTIDGVAGYYLNEDNEYYDKVNIQPWMTYWDRFGGKREAFDKIIGSEPRLKKTPFAFGGAMVIHRNLMRIVPFDPRITRGEDTDYVINARIFGFNFYLDNVLAIKHLPPPKKHPVWKSFREDIFRFLYDKSKFDTQIPQTNLLEIKPEDFDPYPGQFMKPDLGDKIFKTNIILALNYLADNKIEDCKETIKNIYLARYDAIPHNNTFQEYLDFQKDWRKLLEHTKTFGNSLKELILEGLIIKYDKYQIVKKTILKQGGLDENYELENLDFFKDLTKKEKRRILSISHFKHLDPGDYVFHMDEINDSIYLVLNGVLEVSRQNNGDETLIVDEINRGEHFNETSIFVSTPRNVSVQAKTHSDLMIMNKDDLLLIIKENCELSTKIMWLIARKLGDRLSRTTIQFSYSKEQDSDVSDILY